MRAWRKRDSEESEEVIRTQVLKYLPGKGERTGRKENVRREAARETVKKE